MIEFDVPCSPPCRGLLGEFYGDRCHCCHFARICACESARNASSGDTLIWNFGPGVCDNCGRSLRTLQLSKEGVKIELCTALASLIIEKFLEGRGN